MVHACPAISISQILYGKTGLALTYKRSTLLTILARRIGPRMLVWPGSSCVDQVKPGEFVGRNAGLVVRT